MRYRAAVLVGLMVVAGCGSKGDTTGGQVPVSGVVVDSSGKPVGGVDLRFFPTEPGKANASATAGADGTFKVKTSDTIDGLIPGKYKVTVRPGSAKGTTPAKVSAKYDEEGTTDIVVQVESGKELKIELK